MITAPANWPAWAQVLAGLGIVLAASVALLAGTIGLWLLSGGLSDRLEHRDRDEDSQPEEER